MDSRVTVVLPAKNESASIETLVTKLAALPEVGEVIVVDDGSTDETAEKARSAGATVISHAVSLGNGAAIKTGARAAPSEWIIFMDADGQHRPEDIPALVRAVGPGVDMVVGARDKHGQASFGRRIANGFYNWFSSKVSEFPIKDLTSGFRLVRREKFLDVLHLLPNQFSYPTTTTMAFLRSGYGVSFAPVTVLQRQGKSHIRPLRDGFRFLIIIFKIVSLYSPLKVFVPLAIIHFLLGLARYAYTYSVDQTFTNMSALLMVTGVQIFLIGLVSEQITTLIYKERKGA